MQTTPSPPKVSLFARILAWVFVVCTVLGAVGWVIVLLKKGSWPLSRSETVLGGLGLLLIVPLFFVIAFKGRPPRWWTSIDDSLDFERIRQRRLERKRNVR